MYLKRDGWRNNLYSINADKVWCALRLASYVLPADTMTNFPYTQMTASQSGHCTVDASGIYLPYKGLYLIYVGIMQAVSPVNITFISAAVLSTPIQYVFGTNAVQGSNGFGVGISYIPTPGYATARCKASVASTVSLDFSVVKLS